MSYEDIINLPRPVSKTHKSMSMHNRAAQFMPFAALTGYDDSITEATRLTERKVELSEDELAILDEKLQLISEGISFRPEVTVTYFVPDDKKAGGKYVDKTGKVKKIDDVEGCIIFTDKEKIAIKDVVRIA